jgi:putative spermidine/putrescine transport system permease protein
MEKSKWTPGLLLLLIPALIYIFVLFIFPLVYGLVLSLTDVKDGAFTFQNYIDFFSSEYERETILITLGLAVPATLINVILAVPFATLMRRGLKGERIITFFLILPITLGTVLIAQGMLRYLGPVGWFNQFLNLVVEGLNKILEAFQRDPIVFDPIRLTHNNAGVSISIILQGFPFAFLMLLGYVSGINPDLEKAAQMLGASKWQTFWKILFPLMVPGIAIAFCLNFVMAFSVFPSAVMLGEPTSQSRVIAFMAYDWARGAKQNQNMGSAISLIMAVIELAVISIVLFWRQRMYRGASMVGKG